MASFLSLQAAHSGPAGDVVATLFVFPNISCSQAWENLQDNMASLSATSAPEDLVAAEANVVMYQAVALLRNANWQEDKQSDALSLVEDLIRAFSLKL